jgi:hypothetical protein
MIPQESRSVDSDDIVGVIREKTKRYRSVARKLGVEFVVVLVAPEQSPLHLDAVISAIAGRLTTTIDFSLHSAGPIQSTPLRMRKANIPLHLDSALSGVGFLAMSDPTHQLSVIVNDNAEQPLAPRSPIRLIQRDGHPIGIPTWAY